MAPAPFPGRAHQVTPPFTDRTEQCDRFRNAVRTPQRAGDYRVLVFYGAGGHGKTALNEEFQRILQAEKVPFAWLNFDKKTGGHTHRKPHLALKALRIQLGDELKASFPAFDIAFRRFHELSRSGLSFEEAHRELVNKSWILDLLLTGADALAGGIASFLYEHVGAHLGRAAREYYQRANHHLLGDLESLSLSKLYDRLFVCLGADLLRILWGDRADLDGAPAPARRAVVLIDTYEALREELVAKRGPGAQQADDWVRMLVESTPGVLYVITGRDRLQWDEVDPFYGTFVVQEPLDGLPIEDARRALIDAGVSEEPIRELMLEGARIGPDEVLPYYLELQTRQYGRMRDRNELDAGRFGGTHSEVLSRFVQYLDADEVHVMRILAQPRYFDRDLFDRLQDSFFNGVPITYDEISDRSLVAQTLLPDGRELSSMHDLLRDHLIAAVQAEDPSLAAAVNTALLQWHDQAATRVPAERAGPQEQRALEEAAYHASMLGDERYVEWCLERLPHYNWIGFFEVTKPLLRRALEIVEQRAAAPGATDPSGVVDAVANLPAADVAALVRRSVLHRLLGRATRDEGDGGEAELHFKRALRIRQALAPPDAGGAVQEYFAAHQALAQAGADPRPELLRATEQSEARIAALASLASSMIDLAEFYKARGGGTDHGDALRLYDRVLEMRDLLHLESRLRVYVNQSFGSFLRAMGRALEAEPLLFAAWKAYAQFNEQSASVVAYELAKCLLMQGRLSEALRYADQAVASVRAHSGDDHSYAAFTEGTRAEILARQGRYDESLASRQRCREIYRSKLAPDHLFVGLEEVQHARVLNGLGQAREAERRCEEGLSLLKRYRGEVHADVGVGLTVLAESLAGQGRRDDARARFEEALRVLEETAGYDHPRTRECLQGLVSLMERSGDEDAAYYRRHLDQATRSLAVDMELDFPDVRDAEGDEAAALMDRCRAYGSFPDDPSRVRVTLTRLPFLPSHAVARFRFEEADPPVSKYMIVNLDDAGEVHVIDWTSRPCHELLQKHPVPFDATSALQYARLFFESLRSNDGRFRIVEHADRLPWQDLVPAETLAEQRDAVAPFVQPQRLMQASELREAVDAAVDRFNQLLGQAARHNAEHAARAGPGTDPEAPEPALAAVLGEMQTLLGVQHGPDGQGGWTLHADGCTLVDGGAAAELWMDGENADGLLQVRSPREGVQTLRVLDEGRNPRMAGQIADFIQAYAACRHDAFVIRAFLIFGDGAYLSTTGLYPDGTMTMYHDQQIASGLSIGQRKVRPASRVPRTPR